MAERVIIVHTLQHTLDALEGACELHVPIILQSAPDALFYAGSLYLLRMFEQAQQATPTAEAVFILDCSAAGAEAVAAIQAGHRHIRSSAPAPLREKLADIARQYGAEMADGPYEALDLRHSRDTKSACQQWLSMRNV